tara:strand:+ start:892 stop:1671 length:780 start_codon:yes stop_codon:yes gene_type:complete
VLFVIVAYTGFIRVGILYQNLLLKIEGQYVESTSESLLQIFKLVWGSSLLRLGSAIALTGVGTITGFAQYVVEALLLQFVGVELNIPENSGWIGWVLLLIGVVLAIYGSSQQLAANRAVAPNPHDVENLRLLRDFIQPDLLFFRDQNFGFSFDREATVKLEEFVGTWRGAAKDFVDKYVQEKFLDLRSKASKLVIGIETYTYPLGGDMSRLTVDPGLDAHNPEKRAEGAANLLNADATAYVSAVDAFEQVAKARIPIVQ